MQVHRTAIDGVYLFAPAPDAVVTFDVPTALRHGVDPERFVREARTETALRGAVHGLHRGDGPMLVRCARGATYQVVIDARPESRTFGRVATFLLDETERRRLSVPAGCLHGFQSLSGTVETRHRFDTPHTPPPGVTVRVDDPDLAVRWPLPVDAGTRDRSAVRWADLCGRLGAEIPERSCAVGW